MVILFWNIQTTNLMVNLCAEFGEDIFIYLYIIYSWTELWISLLKHTEIEVMQIKIGNDRIETFSPRFKYAKILRSCTQLSRNIPSCSGRSSIERKNKLEKLNTLLTLYYLCSKMEENMVLYLNRTQLVCL